MCPWSAAARRDEVLVAAAKRAPVAATAGHDHEVDCGRPQQGGGGERYHAALGMAGDGDVLGRHPARQEVANLIRDALGVAPELGFAEPGLGDDDETSRGERRGDVLEAVRPVYGMGLAEAVALDPGAVQVEEVVARGIHLDRHLAVDLAGAARRGRRENHGQSDEGRAGGPREALHPHPWQAPRPSP